MNSYAVQYLPISSLKWGEYQRPVDMRRARRIAETFDWDAFDPIIVNQRNGDYYIIDGGHRVKALEINGEVTVPARIMSDLLYTQEARLFVRRNNRRTVKPVTPTQQFWADFEAGDPTVREVVELLGLRGVDARRDIKCYDAIRAVREKFGEKVFAKLAYVLHETDRHPVPAWVVQAVALILHDARGIGRGRVTKIDLDRLGAVIADNWQEIDLTKRARVATVNRGVLAGAEVILDQYNKHLQDAKRLTLAA